MVYVFVRQKRWVKSFQLPKFLSLFMKHFFGMIESRCTFITIYQQHIFISYHYSVLDGVGTFPMICCITYACLFLVYYYTSKLLNIHNLRYFSFVQALMRELWCEQSAFVSTFQNLILQMYTCTLYYFRNARTYLVCEYILYLREYTWFSSANLKRLKVSEFHLPFDSRKKSYFS